MKNLITRTLSGLAFAIVMILGILWSPLSFMLLMLLILAGSLREYMIITAGKRGRHTPMLASAATGILLIGAFLLSYLFLSPPVRALPDGSNLFSLLYQVVMMQRDADISFTAVFSMVIFGLFIVELFSHNDNPFSDLGWNIIAAVWILLPLMLTNKLYFEQGGKFLLIVFFIIWFYDSACYAGGSLFGKHPMFPRISPKKTWEGLIVGIIFTLLASSFLYLIPDLSMLSRWEWVVLSAVLIFTATFGDLAESMLKRSLGIKDSGSIMPGHGGFLDRFDAYFFSVPFVVFTLWVFGQVRGLQLLIDYIGR